ncbi:MAG: hypothetical protein NZ530_08045, partial [Thermodesulfobacteriaceae bacterium]|nr:hypothetical protein [Thermodesulfobacteriaceae bacterium]
PQQWKVWQEERLAYVLHRARHKVPYYREYWDRRRRAGDKASWEILENWPILKKEEVRANPQAFVAEDCDVRRMFNEHTSGTTGTPLNLWVSRRTLREWYALFEARIRRWHGVSFYEPWGIFGGKPVVPFEQKTPPFWVRNYGLNQVYFSVLHIAPWSAPHYIEAIRKFKLTHLIVYTSSLHALACEVPEEDLPVTSNLKVIFTNAEPLFDFQRKKIESVFNCPVRETYGQAEMVCAASECEYGRLHWWPEVGITEILDEQGNKVDSGNAGRLIATGLLNADMPLIRYEVGDLAELGDETNNTCPCGRNLPILTKVLGRNDDVIVTEDGRKLFLLDIIFDPEFPIKEAQIVQESLHQFTIRVVPAEGWNKYYANRLAQALQERVGKVEVNVEEVNQIERTWAGKFRIIVSRLGNR